MPRHRTTATSSSPLLSEVDRAYVIVLADLRHRLREAIAQQAELQKSIDYLEIEMGLAKSRIAKLEEHEKTACSESSEARGEE